MPRELIEELSETLWAKLKSSDGNPSDLLALRTAIQVMRPDLDKLTNAALPILNKYLPEFSGTFLDVGSYGGWVYPHVRGRVEYHGIDTWPTGIETSTKLFGPMFEKIDLFDYGKKHDVVWCSQLLFTGLYVEAWEKCKSLANKLCVFVTPEGNVQYPGAEISSEGRMTIAVWRG